MKKFFELLGHMLMMLLCVGCAVVPLGAWLTHVIICIETAAWGFLIAGAIFFPIGMVHGFGIWMGIWP
jgi:hypothetical protein